MIQDIKQAMNFLASGKQHHTTLNVEVINYWLENYSDTIFCHGTLRQVVFEKITEKMYKVYTIEV